MPRGHCRDFSSHSDWTGKPGQGFEHRRAGRMHWTTVDRGQSCGTSVIQTRDDGSLSLSRSSEGGRK